MARRRIYRHGGTPRLTRSRKDAIVGDVLAKIKTGRIVFSELRGYLEEEHRLNQQQAGTVIDEITDRFPEHRTPKLDEAGRRRLRQFQQIWDLIKVHNKAPWKADQQIKDVAMKADFIFTSMPRYVFDREDIDGLRESMRKPLLIEIRERDSKSPSKRRYAYYLIE